MKVKKFILTFGRTYMKIHTPTMVQEEGGGRIDPQEFLICCSISNDFTFSKKMAKNGVWRHQQWSPSWILPRIRNQVKTGRNGGFFVLEMKNNT